MKRLVSYSSLVNCKSANLCGFLNNFRASLLSLLKREELVYKKE